MLAASTPTAAAAFLNPLSVLIPEGVALVFFIALAIDGYNLGGPKFTWLTDRIAFIGWTAVWAAGFQGSGLMGLVEGSLTAVFEMIAGLAPNAPLFQGFVRIGPQIIGVAAFAIALGCFVPNRFHWLGAFSKLEFSQLKEFGKKAMGRAGITGARGPAAAAAVAAAAAGGGPPPGASPWRKLFPGHVNVGMVTVALLIVTFSTVIKGGVGTLMQLAVGECLVLSADLVAPALRSMGYA